MAKGINTHLKLLEQAMAARFGWQTNASWRDKLIESIAAKSQRLGLDDAAYCRMASRSAGELEVLAEMVNNCETRFFREPDQFQALSEEVIPGLIRLRAKERKLDVWSAACSTGEEAYSLAIVLSEVMAESEGWKASILATDMRGPAIISASRGCYPASSIRLLEPKLRADYFVKGEANGRERSYSIVPAARKMVSFRRANIYDDKFWTNLHRQFDLILCNNLLLYFHALAVKQTVDRMARVLRCGGLLMVMKNEASYVNHPQLRIDALLPGSFFRKL
jgi:chemotaxis protein methyltransferase CheR